MAEDVQILHIEADISTVTAGQIAVEGSNDSDLGYRMWGGKDLAGGVTKFLAKDQDARIVDLTLTGTTTVGVAGLLKHDTVGAVTGGLITVAELNSFLSDGPIGGTPSLTATYVGYGSGSNELTGDQYLTWDATNRWLQIGTGTPDHLSGNDNFYVENALEVDGISYFDGVAIMYSQLKLLDSADLRFGTSSDVEMEYSTAQTNDALILGLSTDSNSFIICEKADLAVNFGHPSLGNPTVFLQEADATDTDKFLAIQCDGEVVNFFGGKGGLFNFQDWSGTANTIDGSAVINLGNNNDIDANYCILAGINNSLGQVSGIITYLIAGGQSLTIDGTDYGIVMANDADVTHDYVRVYGREVASTWEGASHYSGDKLATANGSSMGWSQLTALGSTTSNETITLKWNLADSASPYTVPTGYCMAWTIGVLQAGGDGINYWIGTVLVNAATTTDQSSTFTNTESLGTLGGSVTATTSAGVLNIRCTGDTGDPCDWIANAYGGTIVKSAYNPGG